MKLFNPTDAELDAAFAEKVAGWKRTSRFDFSSVETYYPWFVPAANGSGSGFELAVTRFTRSFDAVLPWLEKTGRWNVFRDVSGVYEIELEDNPMPDDGCWFAFNKSLPRAAVIALLRAHGVQVEFTQ